jgi:hypothetical protein
MHDMKPTVLRNRFNAYAQSSNASFGTQIRNEVNLCVALNEGVYGLGRRRYDVMIMVLLVPVSAGSKSAGDVL